MKNNIITIIKFLEDLGKQFDYSEIETSIVLYLRKTLEDVQEIEEEDIEELQDTLSNFDGSLLNDDIVDYIENNI